MGTYVNPGNGSFLSDVGSDIYVDKTRLLRVLNNAIGKSSRYFAVSRARRFGKSMAAGMIDAYYSRGCDSRELFSPFAIAKDPEFEKHLNQYNVVHFDLGSFLSMQEAEKNLVQRIDRMLLGEMRKEFPFLEKEQPMDTPDAMRMVYSETGRKFVVVIDEYDCLIRDNPEAEDEAMAYLRYLRRFFKTEESKQFLALGYITGILPIKKIKGESTLNVFSEYTMTEPEELLPFFGFTQQEVERLCLRFGIELQMLRKWYDGYYMYSSVSGGAEAEEGEEGEDNCVRLVNGSLMRLRHVYNPNSVVEAFRHNALKSYWKNTGSFDSLRDFIVLNYAGLKDDILQMLIGERIPVDITGFQNDVSQFKNKDDVLACLIHMGYLGYDAYRKEAFIPNAEVAEVFEGAIKTGDWEDVADALRNSDALLRAVWNGEEEKVARAISESHQDYASIIDYHDENALACAIMMSFYTARADYHVVRDLPIVNKFTAGKGFADIAFIPKTEGKHPAMLVELKWNRSARAAIRQIKDKNYEGALKDCRGELLLVGINYTKRSKKYTCRIERNSF